MRNPVAIVAFVALLCLGTGATFFALSAEFTFTHPKAPNVRFVVDSNGKIALADRDKLRRKSAAAADMVVLPKPRAFAQETVYDFAIMNPDTEGEHEFEIFNGGNARLTLMLEKTSCGCTNAEILDSVVEPGESGSVRLSWQTNAGPLFEEGAWIKTNDKERPRVELIIQGEVAAKILSNRRNVRFNAINPGDVSTEEFYLYSGVWEEFELASTGVNLESFGLHYEPVTDPETLEYLGAKAAFRVRLTSPRDMTQGEFRGMVYVTAKPMGKDAASSASEDDEVIKVVVPFTGELLARVGLYGTGIDPAGFIDLGNVDVGHSIKRRYVLRLKDTAIGLDGIHVRTQPSSVNASVIESPTNPGLYYLHLEVPDTAAACSHLYNDPGHMTIAFDDSRLKQLEVELHFAVIQP
jgi:hypothetical protein